MGDVRKRGTGLMARHETEYTPDEIEAVVAAFAAWNEELSDAEPGDWPGDGLRRANAAACRAILAAAGIEDDGAPVVNLGRLGALPDRSAAYIAAYWLAAYHSLSRGRAGLAAGTAAPETLARMLMDAETMGRMQERLWWRAGIDPEAGETRERLALTGKPVKAGQKAGAAATAKAQKPKRDVRLARMAELVQNLPVEKAARQCEAEGLGTWSAIQRQWHRNK
jgi:hypothetical protein